MRYEIFTSDSHKYLVIRIHAQVTEGLLEEFIKKASEMANEANINNFLFDLRRAGNRASITQHWWAIHKLSKGLGFKAHSKHALLVNPEGIKDYEIVETMLFNAGYKSKIFLMELEAVEWLEE
jgi:hypothetical protein